MLRWYFTMLVFGATIGALAWLFIKVNPSAKSEGYRLPKEETLIIEELTNIDIFKFVSPSVVNITTESIGIDRFTLDITTMPKGIGTGFIYDDLGHVVTNYHVIASADSVKVSLKNQRHYPAKLIGVYPAKDLAVLKIDAPKSELKSITLSKQHKLQVGQKVLAIGNPYGYDHTLTVGVISALGRSIQAPYPVDRRIDGVIQTDAAINPGNSGGPLLNSSGHLVGVNTQIASQTGSFSGIGFAIPLETVTWVVPQLIQYGQIQRVGLGIRTVPQHIVENIGIQKGVLINLVLKDGPAYHAGLKGTKLNRFRQIIPGDLILRIDQKEVFNLHDLHNILERYKPGDKVQVHFIREGKEYQTNLRLKLLDNL